MCLFVYSFRLFVHLSVSLSANFDLVSDFWFIQCIYLVCILLRPHTFRWHHNNKLVTFSLVLHHMTPNLHWPNDPTCGIGFSKHIFIGDAYTHISLFQKSCLFCNIFCYIPCYWLLLFGVEHFTIIWAWAATQGTEVKWPFKAGDYLMQVCLLLKWLLGITKYCPLKQVAS